MYIIIYPLKRERERERERERQIRSETDRDRRSEIYTERTNKIVILLLKTLQMFMPDDFTSTLGITRKSREFPFGKTVRINSIC